ncbi:MAG: heparan-alpha-glucosaminide N-acetyltransferase domain-containing protein [Verrucomicrobiales bacterium]
MARIASLDQFRGYTVAGMFFVNFAGGFDAIHPLFKHHRTYCSYADTIMPHFFFAVGFALRLVLSKNRETLGVWPAYRRTLRRIGLLIAIGLGLYLFDWDWLSLEAWRAPMFSEAHFWRDSFQTLVHIGVTSLWVLPVMACSPRIRFGFAAACALLHILLSVWFWYDLLEAKRVIDGGPLGFLTWTIPTLCGAWAFDIVKGAPERVTGRLIQGAVLLMAGGYLLSCLNQGGRLVPPPFWPAPPPYDLWTMSQRAGSVSYQTFAAGFSLAVYATFVWLADQRGWTSRWFAILGQNALAAYLLHTLIDVAFEPLKPRDAALWWVLILTASFIMVNTLLVAWLSRRGWFLRL